MIGVVFASESTSPLPETAPNRSEENRKVKGDDLFGNKLPHFLKVAERLKVKNGGDWIVGDSVSNEGVFVVNVAVDGAAAVVGAPANAAVIVVVAFVSDFCCCCVCCYCCCFCCPSSS